MTPVNSRLQRLSSEIQHGDEETCVNTARTFLEVDDHGSVDALVALLQNSPNPITRRWAAYILGFLGDVQTKPALIFALRDTANTMDVRCHAAEALGHLLVGHRGQEDARAALRDTLDEDSAPLRFWASFALGNIGISKDIPKLRSIAKSDMRVVEGWWSVSKEALDAIEHIRDRGRRRRT